MMAARVSFHTCAGTTQPEGGVQHQPSFHMPPMSSVSFSKLAQPDHTRSGGKNAKHHVVQQKKYQQNPSKQQQQQPASNCHKSATSQQHGTRGELQKRQQYNQACSSMTSLRSPASLRVTILRASHGALKISSSMSSKQCPQFPLPVCA